MSVAASRTTGSTGEAVPRRRVRQEARDALAVAAVSAAASTLLALAVMLLAAFAGLPR